MATRYCGPGGNDANDGLSYAQRKLTLNGLEDSPVQAGDVCYIAPGTYRETLTCDVNGSAGSPITYIGDYTGANTDGVGGVVRITGSDDDRSVVRSYGVEARNRAYRNFVQFLITECTYGVHVRNTSFISVIGCLITHNSSGIFSQTEQHNNLLVERCALLSYGVGANPVNLTQNSASVGGDQFLNTIFLAGHNSNLLLLTRSGSALVKNCLFVNGLTAFQNDLATGFGTSYVYNNLFIGCASGVVASALGDVVEDYNNFVRVATPRSNIAVGANSLDYVTSLDARWFFEAVNGGSMVTPFDLASYSQLVNVAGTSPTTTDLRGTSVIGAQREWGPLEYNPALLIEAGSGGGVIRRVMRLLGG